ncbi:unnamed protein product, partial [Urochloa humidicola]
APVARSSGAVGGWPWRDGRARPATGVEGNCDSYSNGGLRCADHGVTKDGLLDGKRSSGDGIPDSLCRTSPFGSTTTSFSISGMLSCCLLLKIWICSCAVVVPPLLIPFYSLNCTMWIHMDMYLLMCPHLHVRDAMGDVRRPPHLPCCPLGFAVTPRMNGGQPLFS